MKGPILFFIAVLISAITNGQQVSQTTQHMFFKSTLNPAAVGSERYLEAGLWNRSQWTGFEGAPRTQYLSVHSSFYNSRSGIGGYIFNDAVGPTKNTGLSAMYSYKLPVSKEINFSFGLGFMVSNFSVDGKEIELHDENDLLIDLHEKSSTFLPEASVGMYVYHKDFYFGISAINIVNSKTPVFENTTKTGAMPRVLHFNIIGGYEYAIDKEVSIIPSFYISKAQDNPMQGDFNLRLDYSKKFQIGFSYRTQDAIAILLGLRFLKSFNLGYSYDLQYSELKEHTDGSHEISLRYSFYYNAIYKKMDGM